MFKGGSSAVEALVVAYQQLVHPYIYIHLHLYLPRTIELRAS